MNVSSLRKQRSKSGELAPAETAGEEQIISDRGHVASSHPVGPGNLSTPFRERRTLPEFDALPPVLGDSGVYVSDDRDRGRPALAAGMQGRNVIQTE